MKKILRRIIFYFLSVLLVSGISIAVFSYYIPRVTSNAMNVVNINPKEERIEELVKTDEAQKILRLWAEKKYIEEQRNELAEMERQLNTKELSF